MGLFDKFKKNKEIEKKETVEAPALGWDAITAEFERVYPGQTNPKHYATLIKWALGGKDPLDGISIYDGGDYWHFVTFGMTDAELKTLDSLQSVKDIYAKLGSDITDYNRKSLV